MFENCTKTERVVVSIVATGLMLLAVAELYFVIISY